MNYLDYGVESSLTSYRAQRMPSNDKKAAVWKFFDEVELSLHTSGQNGYMRVTLSEQYRPRPAWMRRPEEHRLTERAFREPPREARHLLARSLPVRQQLFELDPEGLFLP